MAKPLPTQNTFSGVAPPWSLVNLDANFTNLWGAINDIGTYSNTLQDTGSTNSLVANPPAGVTFALTAGIAVLVIAGNNTTALSPTLNVNSTGAKPITDNMGNGLFIGGIQAGGRYIFVYDGTNWRCLNPVTGLISTAIKQVTTSRTSTTTQTNDPDLAITLSSAGYYEFEILIYPWGTTTSTQGLSWNVNYSGTVNTTSYVTLVSSIPTSISGIAAIAASPATSVFGVGSAIGTSQGGVSIYNKGILAAASSGGVLAFSWAQSVSTASATNIGQGSYMKVTWMG